MTVTKDRTILILDRLGKATRAEVDAIAGPLKALAAEAGLNGVGVFPFEVDLGDDDVPDPPSVIAYPDEIAALEWAIGFLRSQTAIDCTTHARTLEIMRERWREAQP
jgi:hypothetical protein